MRNENAGSVRRLSRSFTSNWSGSDERFICTIVRSTVAVGAWSGKSYEERWNDGKRTLHVRGRQDKTRGELEYPGGFIIIGGAIFIDADSIKKRRCQGRYVCVGGRAVHRGHWKTLVVGIFGSAVHKSLHVRLFLTCLSMLGAFRPTAAVSGGLLWSVYARLSFEIWCHF